MDKTHDIPIDKMAAIVVSRNKDDQRYFKRQHKISSTSKLPTKMWHGLIEYDLTGRKFGRFTVVGPLATMKKYLDGCRWVVKCTCGRYEVRRTKTIKKGGQLNMCSECGRTNAGMAILEKDKS